MTSSLPQILPRFFHHAIQSFFTGEPRPGLQPIPGTKPLTFEALLCPVLLYYIALLLLPPSSSSSPSPSPSPQSPQQQQHHHHQKSLPASSPTSTSFQISTLRNLLALSAAYFFLRLPCAYHVPQSIGLTYQLGLVGVYGGLRVLDAFFVSYYGFGHVPRRVRYSHLVRAETPRGEVMMRPWADGGSGSGTDDGGGGHGGKGGEGGEGMRGGAKQGQQQQQQQPTVIQDDDGSTATTKTANFTSVEKNHQNPESSSLRPRPHPPPRIISQSDLLENMTSQSYTDLLNNDDGYMTLMKKLLDGPKPIPVTETAHTEDGWPHGFGDRAAWALELELSMRGVGFTWTTADVRHTTKTWLPTVQNRVHSILVHVGPVLVVAWAIIKTIYVKRLAVISSSSFSSSSSSSSTSSKQQPPPESPFDALTFPEQYLLTAALGAFLMAAFSLGHSLFAILCSPLAPSPLAFFPPLYTTRVWEITSARSFWSYGWHRLFARLFLVWGVWPGEWVERKLLGKRADQAADVGKVLGGFLSSAVVHAFSVRSTLGGKWSDAAGEAKFFAYNGVAILVEELVKMGVKKWRRSRGRKEKMWYDAVVGRIWWIGLLLTTGRNFARGWAKAGLVREMAFM